MNRARYRFGDFLLSPARRTLTHAGREIPLIPRYFDLLVLLLERRGEAVSRHEILDRVWNDVVVSDGALSQAVRTLRRALEDDPRHPMYIRTVSRHGYRFIHPDVSEEPDTGEPAAPPAAAHVPEADTPAPAPAGTVDTPPPPPRADAVAAVLLDPGAPEEERRDAAETLHGFGTREALRRVGGHLETPHALALLRDTRWDVAGAGPVPLLGRPGGAAALVLLARWRLRRLARVAGERWAAASGGGAVAGLVAGLAGGLVLLAAPGSAAPGSLPAALAVVGAIVGALGAAGVGAGLAVAEALARSARAAALVACGAIGGGAIGGAAHLLGAWTLQDLFGHDFSAVGGGLEGLVIGAAAGLGYAWGTPRPQGGLASPRGRARARACLTTGLCCAAGCLILAAAGRRLGGDSLDLMARSFRGSQVSLMPLARLLGEQEVGMITRGVLSAYEGLLFGCGLAFGLTRRPGGSR
jgi:DNA-binding winged helix-turn-helix (wHTH) protein